MGCVYLITNTVNGKQYVGMTTRTLDERWSEHCAEARLGRGFYLHSAIQKYGPESFCLTCLFESNEVKDLVEAEKHFIADLDTIANGYNQAHGGEGFNLTEEALNRRADSVRNALQRPAVRSRLSASISAAYQNPELRRKKSAESKLSWTDPVVRENRIRGTKAWAAKPENKIKRIAASKKAQIKRYPNVFCDGKVFQSSQDAADVFSVSWGSVINRCNSENPRWRWWFRIPNHNDPECDAVEECHAIMQWAEAKPDHPNVPEWARPKPDPELVALEQEIKEMLAERRRRQAASSERASAAA